ncbi:MAG TPA: allantoinase AllB [Candidatus Tectomicrobia bacterium]|nr:allantoinase AllB [Candidatus Tectomicrobia bacterium]
MTVDLVVRGGTVVTPHGRLEGGVAVDGGVIVAVAADGALPAARETIDARGRHVLPGVIDAHVHFREPGFEYKEDWASGTAAAACGGVTTVLEMPNTRPPTATPEALRLKQERAARGARVDYGLYGLLGADNADRLEALAAGGVIGFKCYMGETVGALPAPDDGVMLEEFQTAARLGLRVAVHAENNGIMQQMIRRLKAAGRTDPLAHVESRPALCAVEATSRALLFAEWTGAKLHICHESCKQTLPLICAARRRGVDVTVETCPHYLLLTSADMGRLGSVLRMNPPVRAAGHDAALWDALLDGTIDMISTDHSPHAIEEKTQPDIWHAVSGFPGVETAVPLMLTEVNRGRLTLERYVEVASANPARAWGLYPRKGALAPGSDADITIVDLARRGVIRGAALHSKSRITPFEGVEVAGLPVCTIVRGRVVMRDGAPVGEPGWGRPVTPAAAAVPA